MARPAGVRHRLVVRIWFPRPHAGAMMRAVRSRADSVSICLAGACAVHCVATPVVIGLLPLVGLRLADSRLEIALLLTSLAVSGLTLCNGCLRHHRRWAAAAPFAVGAAVLLGRQLAGDSVGTVGDVAIVAIGATLVVSAHVLNIRLCRRAGSGCGHVAAGLDGCGDSVPG